MVCVVVNRFFDALCRSILLQAHPEFGRQSSDDRRCKQQRHQLDFLPQFMNVLECF